MTGRNNLCLSLESSGIWEAAHVVGERTLVAEELDISTIGLEVTIGSLGDVLLTGKRSETPLLADDLGSVSSVHVWLRRRDYSRSFGGLGTCTEHGGEPQWRLVDLEPC